MAKISRIAHFKGRSNYEKNFLIFSETFVNLYNFREHKYPCFHAPLIKNRVKFLQLELKSSMLRISRPFD